MSSDEKQTESRLRLFLAEVLQLDRPDDIGDDDDLFDLGLTSHGFIRLLGFLTTDLGGDLDAGLQDLDTARTLRSIHQRFFPKVDSHPAGL